ncbi:GTPase ObgE [Candidatus Margulisiibacteriota bacterium]
MFIDEAHIYVKAGDGGKGCLSFRREKFVPRGGPDGGNGGKGGDVIFRAHKPIRTLLDFRHKQHFKAEYGQYGMGANKTGKNGDDLIIKVPCGTEIIDKNTGKLLADLVADGDELIIAKGGDGGKGNAHYKSSTNQAPRKTTSGFLGEEKDILLKLKLIADVGLVGCPNAGKSTLLSIISAAHPKIADYPFTTISPNLGAVKIADEASFVAADIPGLLEGAHEGTGLGDRFLKHIERTKLLIHVIDAAGVDGRDPYEDFKTINNELEKYSEKLAKLPQIIALNKLDLTEAVENEKELLAKIKKDGFDVHSISGATKKGIKELVSAAYRKLNDLQ